jgi:hypothetical protein
MKEVKDYEKAYHRRKNRHQLHSARRLLSAGSGINRLKRKNAPSGYGDGRHLRYIREHRKAFYTGLLLDGKLNGYLADLNEQAEDMFFRLVNELAKKEGITETLKAENQMLWV